MSSATLRDMINWCIEKPNEGVKIDPKGTASVFHLTPASGQAYLAGQARMDEGEVL